MPIKTHSILSMPVKRCKGGNCLHRPVYTWVNKPFSKNHIGVNVKARPQN